MMRVFRQRGSKPRLSQVAYVYKRPLATLSRAFGVQFGAWYGFPMVGATKMGSGKAETGIGEFPACNRVQPRLIGLYMAENA